MPSARIGRSPSEEPYTLLILGISDSHNAAAASLDDSGRLRALQEERPRREKNYFGMPTRAVKWLLTDAGIAAEAVDIVALGGRHTPSAHDRASTIRMFRRSSGLPARLKHALSLTPLGTAVRARMLRARLAAVGALGFRPEAIRIFDHHECHAATAYWGWGKLDEPILVLTNDGAGDGLCATVGIGRDGRIERVASVPLTESFAEIYALVTYLTGMVPLEHEYKIMGMAPYAKGPAARKVADKLLGLFEWDAAGAPVWRRRPGVPSAFVMKRRLEALFFEERFDGIMAGTQLFVEDMLREWVRRAVATTGIRKVALAGGVFMNVKANKEILALDEVEDIYVYPSCGDETNAIGACYLAMAEARGSHAVPALGAFYLGPEWSREACAAALAEAQADGRIVVTEPPDRNAAVAELLAAGEVVARFDGPEEFGARSLGNRAIMADPRRPELIKTINEMVKNRDFWMPFAASVLDEDAGRYLINPKGVAAPYMILSFDTTPEGAEQVRAGVHPYDLTCRPQVVTQEHNPAYWDLIRRFRDLTGVGALLNTSLNLHGSPLVHRPEDAVEVLLESGLNHLACGPFLASKPGAAKAASRDSAVQPLRVIAG